MTADNTAATTVEPGSEPDGNELAGQPGADSAPAAADAGANGKPQDGFTRRIDELTRNWRDTERDRDHWRELALRNQQPPTQDRREPREGRREEPGEPELKTLADFNFDERAYTKYVVSEARKAATGEADKLRREFRDSQTQADREYARAEFEDRAQSWAKAEKIEDIDLAFRDPRDGGPHITEAMADSIMDSELGPALLHYLAKNRTVSAQIARMSPLQQAREIGRLEAKLAKRPAPQVSSAPPPHPQVSGASDTAAGKKDPAQMTDDEWYAAQKRAANFKKK